MEKLFAALAAATATIVSIGPVAETPISDPSDMVPQVGTSDVVPGTCAVGRRTGRSENVSP